MAGAPQVADIGWSRGVTRGSAPSTRRVEGSRVGDGIVTGNSSSQPLLTFFRVEVAGEPVRCIAKRDGRRSPSRRASVRYVCNRPVRLLPGMQMEPT
eukprot:1157116-Pleurochrysis_carterae.AAC.2